MATYYVLGLEPFKMAEVWGVHGNRKVAEQQAEALERTKNIHCCQNYKVLTETQIKREKWELFS